MAQYREEQQQHHVTRNFYHQQRLRTATATMNGNYSALFFKSKSNQHTLNYINLNYWRQYCNYLPLIFRELLFNNYLLSRNNQRATTITTTVGEFSSSEQPWINFNFFLSPVATMQARQHRRNGLEILPLLDIYGTKPQQQHDLSPSTLSTSSSGVLSVDDHNNKSSTNKVPLSSFAIKHGNSGNNLDNIKNDGNNDKNNDNNSNSRSEFERRLSTTALTKAYFNTNLKRQKLEQKENIEKLVAEKLLVKDSAEQHQYFILNNKFSWIVKNHRKSFELPNKVCIKFLVFVSQPDGILLRAFQPSAYDSAYTACLIGPHFSVPKLIDNECLSEVCLLPNDGKTAQQHYDLNANPLSRTDNKLSEKPFFSGTSCEVPHATKVSDQREFLSENYNAQNFPKLPRHLLTDYYRRDNQRKISSNENLKKDYISGSNYYNNTQQQRSSRKPLSSRQTQRDVYIPQYINDRQQSYSRSASQSVTVDFERGFSLKSSGNRYQRNHPARFLGIRSGSYRNYRDRNAYYGRRSSSSISQNEQEDHGRTQKNSGSRNQDVLSKYPMKPFCNGANLYPPTVMHVTSSTSRIQNQTQIDKDSEENIFDEVMSNLANEIQHTLSSEHRPNLRDELSNCSLEINKGTDNRLLFCNVLLDSQKENLRSFDGVHLLPSEISMISRENYIRRCEKLNDYQIQRLMTIANVSCSDRSNQLFAEILFCSSPYKHSLFLAWLAELIARELFEDSEKEEHLGSDYDS
ncbi:unnamed protein product [Dracunculus medinensis]|uniref:CABIT domain-containing protein n=1 Tax=Dracunculus medinensis TaxID=318479 RepID=A0A0N4ULF1_DRAME|nr:unnamed protein product [Dracunculus medinensis]